MMAPLTGVLVAAAAVVTILVVFAVARRVFTGQLTPLDVAGLVKAQEQHIALLDEQNTALRKEREFDRKELVELIRNATESQFAMNLFLQRYESLGGMVMADRRHTPPEST